jgi:hypothetical protein
MKKLIAIVLAVVMALTLGITPVFAGIGSDIPDTGEHYNLNIIGVPRDKTVPDMTDSNRHTIFVPLERDGSVSRTVRINVVRNTIDPTSFQVWDGNATDDDVAVIAVPFETYGKLSFNVYAVGLGKPNREADVYWESIYDSNTYTTTPLFGTFTIKRGQGKPQVVNISDIFRASGFIDLGGTPGLYDPDIDIQFTNVWVFNIPTLLSYYWDYTNEGLKLMQVRFHPTTSGSWNIP